MASLAPELESTSFFAIWQFDTSVLWCSSPETSDTAPQTICLRLSSVCFVFINIAFEGPLRIIGLWQLMGWMGRPQRTSNLLLGLQKCYAKLSFNYWLYRWFCSFAPGTPIHSHHLNLKKNYTRICSLYPSQFTVFEMKMSPIILVALTAHHTPNFTSFNGTSCSVYWARIICQPIA